jgi:hypothetical protein
VYAAVWCLTALILLIADWKFWSHRSASVPEAHVAPAVEPSPTGAVR